MPHCVVSDSYYNYCFVPRAVFALITFLSLALTLSAQSLEAPWTVLGHDPQHTGLSAVEAQPLHLIHWSTPIDLDPPYGAAHYGSPIITSANTVIVPVKTGFSDGFEIQARNGATGELIYTLATDYTLPPYNWLPPYGPVLSVLLREYVKPAQPYPPGSAPFAEPVSRRLVERLYYAGPGGTVYYRDSVDSPATPDASSGATGQIAFYGNGVYDASRDVFNGAVYISTPLQSDHNGNVFFGFGVLGTNPANVVSGIARIDRHGEGVWASAGASAGGDPSITQVAANCTPALSRDERVLYFAVSGGDQSGYLVSVDSTTLAPIAHIALQDPSSPW
jgi:hypothetical protein